MGLPAERQPAMRDIAGILTVFVVVFGALWAVGLIR
jgi:hypothetical protein